MASIEAQPVIIWDVAHTFGPVNGVFRRRAAEIDLWTLAQGLGKGREKSLDVDEPMYIHSSRIRRCSLRDVSTLTDVAKKKKKKDAQLVLRLNKDLRNRFVDACQELDTTAAREVRRFIKQFLKRYDRGEFDE